MPILTAEERIGTTLAGKYRLDRILGAGGMGTVYAGVHAWTSREVAVKMLNPEYATDKVVVQRFLQEARSAAQLKHPNVVDVLDMGQSEDGSVYLVLELLEGAPLTDLIARGPMPASGALARLLPVIDALAAAHARGIVHRDLKPDNIFLALTPQGRVVPKLLDFGIAKVAGGSGAKTSAGFIVGTPEYMSPEQAQGKADVGPASDVWSMGVVLFECLTGRLPFEAESSVGLLVAICSKPAPGVRTFGVEVPPAVAEVVDRALAADPGKRFADAREFAQALHEAASSIKLDGLGVAPAATPPTTGVPQRAANEPVADRATNARTVSTPFTWAGVEAVSAARSSRGVMKWAAAGVGLFILGVTGALVAINSGDASNASPVPATVAPSVPVAAPVPAAGAPLPPLPTVAVNEVTTALPTGIDAPDAGQIARVNSLARNVPHPAAAAQAPVRAPAAATPVATPPPVAAQPVPTTVPPTPATTPPPGFRWPRGAQRPPAERGASGVVILD